MNAKKTGFVLFAIALMTSLNCRAMEGDSLQNFSLLSSSQATYIQQTQLFFKQSVTANLSVPKLTLIGLTSASLHTLATKVPYLSTILTSKAPTWLTTALNNPKVAIPLIISIVTAPFLFHSCHATWKRRTVTSIPTPPISQIEWESLLMPFPYSTSAGPEFYSSAYEGPLGEYYYHLGNKCTKICQNNPLQSLIFIYNNYDYLNNYSVIKEEMQIIHRNAYKQLFKNCMQVKTIKEAYQIAEWVSVNPPTTGMRTICIDSQSVNNNELNQLQAQLASLNNMHRLSIIIDNQNNRLQTDKHVLSFPTLTIDSLIEQSYEQSQEGKNARTFLQGFFKRRLFRELYEQLSEKVRHQEALYDCLKRKPVIIHSSHDILIRNAFEKSLHNFTTQQCANLLSIFAPQNNWRYITIEDFNMALSALLPKLSISDFTEQEEGRVNLLDINRNLEYLARQDRKSLQEMFGL